MEPKFNFVVVVLVVSLAWLALWRKRQAKPAQEEQKPDSQAGQPNVDIALSRTMHALFTADKEEPVDLSDVHFTSSGGPTTDAFMEEVRSLSLPTVEPEIQQEPDRMLKKKP